VLQSGGDRGLDEASKESEPKAVEKPKCSKAPRVVGTIKTPDGSYGLRLSRLVVDASMKHKVDIDPYEDRCVNNVRLVLEEGAGGCRLELELSADGGQETLALSKARFEANSYCRDWPDALEGVYVLPSKARFEVDPMLVKDSTASESCTSHRIRGGFRLSRLSGERSKLLVEIEAKGVFPSVGDASNSLVCPGTVQPKSVASEVYVGVGAAGLPGAGDELDLWDYSSPVLATTELGYRLGRRWFGGFQLGPMFGEEMFVSGVSKFKSRSARLELGYRFGSDSRFQVPLALAVGARTFEVQCNSIGEAANSPEGEGWDEERGEAEGDINGIIFEQYDHHGEGDRRCEGYDDSGSFWALRVQPSYHLAKLKRGNLLGYLATEILSRYDGTRYLGEMNFRVTLGVSFRWDIEIQGQVPD